MTFPFLKCDKCLDKLKCVVGECEPLDCAEPRFQIGDKVKVLDDAPALINDGKRQ